MGLEWQVWCSWEPCLTPARCEGHGDQAPAQAMPLHPSPHSKRSHPRSEKRQTQLGERPPGASLSRHRLSGFTLFPVKMENSLKFSWVSRSPPASPGCIYILQNRIALLGELQRRRPGSPFPRRMQNVVLAIYLCCNLWNSLNFVVETQFTEEKKLRNVSDFPFFIPAASSDMQIHFYLGF